MSNEKSRAVRSPSTSQQLHVETHPNPFDPQTGYTAVVRGGIPPYTWTALGSPPNPQGVQITPDGNTCVVTCPMNTPAGTQVYVKVTDSSDPAREGYGSASVAD